MSLKNILKNGIGFENIINKESDKLKSKIDILKKRKLSPKQQEKLKMIESIFSNLSSDKIFSEEGRKDISQNMDKLKKQ